MQDTVQTTRPFPKPVRLSIYLGAVLIFSFLNWVALHAEDPPTGNEKHLAAAIVEEAEAEIRMESRMLTFSDTLLWDRGLILAKK